jgi:dihydrofolate reductase
VIAIVVAHARNRVIGRDGGLPWRLPSDLRRFRELTVGHTVLMGRRTFESLPERFRPLPERRNLVLSRDPAYAPAGAEVFADLDAALVACDGDCYVIGGEETYRQALPRCERVYATEIEAEPAGDAFFPAIDAAWSCADCSERHVENELPFTFKVYERVAASV